MGKKKVASECRRDKVMRCLRYVTVGLLDGRPNGEPLWEVNCSKFPGSQMAADGGCERNVVLRMNEGYKTLGALKSVPSNRRLG